MSFGQRTETTRSSRFVVSAFSQPGFPRNAVHRKGQSAATPKKISLKGSNKHNFIKWNMGIKTKAAYSIWQQNEITINREGRFAHIRQTRRNPLLKPLMWRDSNISCRKITQLTTKYKSNLCLWPCDWWMGGSGKTALTFHQPSS